MKKIIKMSILIIFIISAFLIIEKMVTPGSIALIKDEKSITRILNKKYPSHIIKDLQLQYVDWSSTISSANKDNKATRATVIINNANEQRTIRLIKNLFGIWVVTDDEPDYGANIPNDIYFIVVTYESIGRAVDIEEHIKNNNYWAIPDEKGNYYRKSGSTENWYYSLKHYKEIYKTKDNKIFVFNKKKNDWEETDIKYSDLCYYGNYEKVDKNFAIEIIEKYSSYKEYK